MNLLISYSLSISNCMKNISSSIFISSFVILSISLKSRWIDNEWIIDNNGDSIDNILGFAIVDFVVDNLEIISNGFSQLRSQR